MNLIERLGDCIYDYSQGVPLQRPSVHGRENVETDLSGKNVLISRDFYYWGSRAIRLPEDLLPICHQTQGHKSDSNAPYFDHFVNWVRGLGFERGLMHGWPDFVVDWETIDDCGGCMVRETDGKTDPAC